MSEWISVKDRLPSAGESVICYRADDGWQVICDYMDDDFFYICDDELTIYHAITHWMPLPEPPK